MPVYSEDPAPTSNKKTSPTPILLVSNKEIEVYLYADKEQIRKLKAHGYKLDVRENLPRVEYN